MFGEPGTVAIRSQRFGSLGGQEALRGTFKTVPYTIARAAHPNCIPSPPLTTTLPPSLLIQFFFGPISPLWYDQLGPPYLGPTAANMAGETGPISASVPVDMIIAGFFAIACYNCIDILISLLYRFKRHDGLYFWSMVTATLGIVLHSIVVLLRYYSLGPNFPLAVLTCIGWYGMVTGQSVVLYSRLHLVISDRSRIRWVLIMIIINFCILHIPVTVLFLGSNTRRSNQFLPAFDIYERIQLAGFSIQESIISGLYIWEASHGLKPIFAIKKIAARKVIRHLIIVNILVVFLDISLIITQYLDHFQIATTYKPVVYSIKLKMEFVVLNRLLVLVRHRECNCMQVVDEPSGILPQPSYLNITECCSNEPTPSPTGSKDNGIRLHHILTR
ncbi:hypothetical protein BGZ61DRAFT_64984 [Ilyonectria robusta]|uniref:uncharacterized protein n=1 Tax=Ilyonectria robusta TaxID=1079257 RepID=UPI001E8D0A35|nr:uncharacterized protein BGZ61DRAFT_64984 [Ilyonectria robusta]KAH8646454.1 hypothetical protein BGZ61DRAFT_64984 [Ilyonectria robusta]